MMVLSPTTKAEPVTTCATTLTCSACLTHGKAHGRQDLSGEPLTTPGGSTGGCAPLGQKVRDIVRLCPGGGHGREWHVNVALLISTDHNTTSSSTKVQLQALYCLSNKLSCVREVPTSSETAAGGAGSSTVHEASRLTPVC